MINNELALEFKDIDIEDYFNKKYDRIDLIEMESELSVMKSLLNKIDENLFNYIVDSGETLIDLLEVYQECTDILKNFKKVSFEEIQEERVEIFNEKLAEQFKLFEDEMSLYLTENRYLLCSGFFNNRETVALLTNDLLFIGEKARNKFKLKRALLYSFYKMERIGNTLLIKTEESEIKLKGDSNILQDFIDFSQKPRSFDCDDEHINTGLIDYYIETENYEKLKEYLKSNKNIIKKALEVFEIKNEKMLYALKEIYPKDFLKNLLVKKFKDQLYDINPVQTYNSYIKDLFDLLKNFSIEIKVFFSDISNSSYVLCIEQCVIALIDFIKERTAIHSSITSKVETEKILEKYLCSLDLNFSYLLKVESLNKSLFLSKNLESSKKKIYDLVNKYLEES